MSGVIWTDSLIADPTLEPLDLEEVKKHLRFTPTTEDTLLDTDISAARHFLEMKTGRHVLATIRERWASAFPSDVIEFPYPPLLTVVSVTYIDGDGVDQVLVENTDYKVIAPVGLLARPGWIEPAYNMSWPSARGEAKSVRIRYTAGYGTTLGTVPELVRKTLQLLIGDYHKYRTNTLETKIGEAFLELPFGVTMMIADLKETARPRWAPWV